MTGTLAVRQSHTLTVSWKRSDRRGPAMWPNKPVTRDENCRCRRSPILNERRDKAQDGAKKVVKVVQLVITILSPIDVSVLALVSPSINLSMFSTNLSNYRLLVSGGTRKNPGDWLKLQSSDHVT